MKHSMKTTGASRNFLDYDWVAGILVLAIAVVLFAVIAENVVNDGGLTKIDSDLAQWLHANHTAMLTQCLLLLTHLHEPIALSVVAALLTLYLIWKKHWYAMWAVLLGVQGGMLLNLLAKQMFQRARPSFENPVITLTTYSFPSGHVVASTVFYGVLAALLISQTLSRRRAACILVAALTMIVLVAFSRMYLGAHYLSDVLAAFLEAIAWLALCLTAIQACGVYCRAEKT